MKEEINSPLSRCAAKNYISLVCTTNQGEEECIINGLWLSSVANYRATDPGTSGMTKGAMGRIPNIALKKFDNFVI